MSAGTAFNMHRAKRRRPGPVRRGRVEPVDAPRPAGRGASVRSQQAGWRLGDRRSDRWPGVPMARARRPHPPGLPFRRNNRVQATFATVRRGTVAAADAITRRAVRLESVQLLGAPCSSSAASAAHQIPWRHDSGLTGLRATIIMPPCPFMSTAPRPPAVFDGAGEALPFLSAGSAEHRIVDRLARMTRQRAGFLHVATGRSVADFGEHARRQRARLTLGDSRVYTCW